MQRLPTYSEKTYTNGYTYIKNEKGIWQLKARYLIEQHLGIELPKEVFIWFKDGNKQNYNLSNHLIYDTSQKMQIFFAHTRPVGEAILVWSRKYKKCRKCGTTENKHSAKGYCTNCYKSLHNKGEVGKL